jgi:uncharacterized protein YxeA
MMKNIVIMKIIVMMIMISGITIIVTMNYHDDQGNCDDHDYRDNDHFS